MLLEELAGHQPLDEVDAARAAPVLELTDGLHVRLHGGERHARRPEHLHAVGGRVVRLQTVRVHDGDEKVTFEKPDRLGTQRRDVAPFHRSLSQVRCTDLDEGFDDVTGVTNRRIGKSDKSLSGLRNRLQSWQFRFLKFLRAAQVDKSTTRGSII